MLGHASGYFQIYVLIKTTPFISAEYFQTSANI